MKKNLTIILILFFISNYAQIDTSVLKLWNGATYENSKKIIEHYNSACISIGYNTYSWKAGVFVNEKQTSYTLDVNNNITKKLYQARDSTTSSWKDDSDLTYYYNSLANMPDSVVKRRYATTSASWNNLTKTVYNYNITGLPTDVIVYRWDSTNGNWTNSFGLKYAYTYTASNTIDTMFESYWDNANSVWVDHSKTGYVYNAQQKLLSTTSLLWSDINNYWENYRRYSYYYNANDDLEIYFIEVGDSATSSATHWKFYRKKNFYYNATQIHAVDSTEEMDFRYNGIGPSYYGWFIYEKKLFTNDNKSRPLTEELSIGVQGWPDYYYDNFSLTINNYIVCSPLAIKGLKFFAKSVAENKIILNWSFTGNNSNNNIYYLQRSNDGKNFINISTMPANLSQYTFTDVLNIGTEKSFYYRLMLQHYDGTAEYSDIQLIRRYVNSAIPDLYNIGNILYVNPNSDNGAQKKAKLIITSALGQQLIEQQFFLSNTIKQFDIKNLSSGVYVASLVVDNKIIANKFYKF